MGNDIFQKIINYLQQNSDIEVVWLYGSHAKGTAQPHSDIDIAIAYKNFDLSSFDKRLRPKELELEISNALSLNEQLISIVDINLIPSYLAFNIVEYGCVILGKNSLRAMREQQRIYSQFEFEMIALYFSEVTRHIDEYMQELDELSQIDQLNNRDYRAAERLLQLMTEVCIGLSKHWLKKYKNTTSSNAYQTFSELTQLGILTDNELLSWRKIIGLRNALVHNYLNIDQEIVKTIIKKQHYLTMHLFSQKAMAELAS